MYDIKVVMRKEETFGVLMSPGLDGLCLIRCKDRGVPILMEALY